MDIQEAIRILVSAGYKVTKPSPKSSHPIFVCGKGHAHRSHDAMLKCDKPTGPVKRRGVEDYVEAYRMRQAGQTYSSIGKHFGITASRVTQLVKKAERAALAKADGRAPSNNDGLHARIYELI